MKRTQRRFLRAALALSLVAAITASAGVAAAQPTIDIGISNLTDGQTVNLTITGFEPNTSIIAGQCDAAIAEYDQIGLSEAANNCQLENSTGLSTTTDSNGTYATTFTFNRHVNPFFGSSSIDCAQEGACVLGATTYTSNYSSMTLRTIPTLFVGEGSNAEPSAAPVAIELEVDGNKLVPRNKDTKDKAANPKVKTVSKSGLSITDVHVGLADGRTTVTIDFACDEPMEVSTKKLVLKQKRKGATRLGALLTSETVSCDGTGSMEIDVAQKMRRGSARLQVVLRGAEKGQRAAWTAKTKIKRLAN